MKAKYLLIPLALGLGLALVWVLGGRDGAAVAAPVLSPAEGPRAEGRIEAPSAPATELHVCPSGCTYSSIQDAVDAANDGDVIKVAAGIYTDVHVHPRNDITTTGSVTQVVYISKTVTIRGGYAIDNWTMSDPENNPTALHAGGQGRVLYITGDISPTIEGLRITGGDAAGLRGIGAWPYHAGGGVYAITAAVTIRDNRIFSNTASEDGCGGGLLLLYSPATISGNTVTDNTAGTGGGLYLHDSPATISGNIVTDNAAAGGGGGLLLWGSDATLSGNAITDNAANRGGGLFLYERGATLSGNAIANNSAGIRGGGLFLYESVATLSGNVITDNAAAGGGGLFLWGSDATLINNVIANNQANVAGSGLSTLASSSRLLHNTIASNTGGDGSGIYVAAGWGPYSTVALTNTILVGHRVGISVTEGITAILESTLWNDNTTDWGGGGTISHSNDRTGDPAFVNPDAGDYNINPGSAAIDAGVDAGVDHDIDGDPRPLGSGYDLGADEAGLIVVKQAYPDRVQPGAPLTYTIRITNPYDMELHATITDTLPEQITLGRTSAGTLILPGGVVTWTPVSLAPQGVWTETVVVTVETGYAGPLVNVVEATTAEGVSGRYVHTLAPDLTVTKQAHAETVQPGKQLTYTITITNTGNFDLHATITDTLPAHVTTGATAGGTTVLPGGKLVWTPLIPAPGGVWMRTVVVTAEVGYAGPLTNLVEVATKEGAIGEASVTVSTGSTVYLPLVMRDLS